MKDNYGLALMNAIKEKNIETITTLSIKKIDISDTEFEWGASPLEYAVEQGNLEIVKLLISLGFDLYRGVEYSPIKCAISGNRLDIVLEFLNAGIDLNSPVFSKDDYGWTPLIYAAYTGYPKIVQSLVEYGADMNARTSDGYTSLIYAACKGHLEIVKFLVNSGANVNLETVNGVSAFSCALDRGDKEIIDFLF